MKYSNLIIPSILLSAGLIAPLKSAEANSLSPTMNGFTLCSGINSGTCTSPNITAICASNVCTFISPTGTVIINPGIGFGFSGTSASGSQGFNLSDTGGLLTFGNAGSTTIIGNTEITTNLTTTNLSLNNLQIVGQGSANILTTNNSGTVVSNSTLSINGTPCTLSTNGTTISCTTSSGSALVLAAGAGISLNSSGGTTTIIDSHASDLAAISTINTATANECLVTTGTVGSWNNINCSFSNSWTPTFSINGATGFSVTYGTTNGYYSRIGNVIYATATMTFTPTYSTGTGNVQIGGFPIAAANNSIPAGFELLQTTSAFTWPGTSPTQLNMQINPNSTYAFIYGSKSGGVFTPATGTLFTSGSTYTITFSGFYFITATQ